MPRIMALDVGTKTIGVAFTDESRTLVTPGETILRHEGYRRDMAAVRSLVAEREVGLIVVGVPLEADGGEGDQAAGIHRFVQQLRGSVRIPIVLQDEAFTTAGADAILDELRIPRDRRKQTIDSVAAVLILQDYLARP